MKITIYGSGYVGLVTGACMAQVGNDVLCVDSDTQKIERLSRCEVKTHEPSLDQMIIDNINAGRLNFTSSAQQGVEHGLYQFITVNIPVNEDGTADLKHIFEVADSIAENISTYRIIISKSTVPVGTGDKIKEMIQRRLVKRRDTTEFDMVSNPEFIKVGAAIDDFMKPDRLIIGCDNPRTTELMRELYAPFNHNRDRLVTMDVKSAEMTKYAANALLATKISFMNELSNIAELQGGRHRTGAYRNWFRPANWVSLYLSGLRLWRITLPQRRASFNSLCHRGRLQCRITDCSRSSQLPPKRKTVY